MNARKWIVSGGSALGLGAALVAWHAATPIGVSPVRYAASSATMSSAAPATRAAPTAVSTVPASVKILRDVAYVTHGDGQQKLDIAVLTGRGPAPLIVWVHGGGWIMGNKSLGGLLSFAREGYAVSAINYRLCPQAVFPAQIEDCKAAIRFLRAHAAEYNIDPERIGVWGESAGGHLAALLGTTGGEDSLAGKEAENVGVSDRVQCVVDFFGPTDLLAIPAMAGANVQYDFYGPDSLLTKFLGGPMNQRRELAELANPLAHIRGGDPPFLIVHGTADPIVPVGQSRILSEALAKAHIPAELMIVEGAGHGDGIHGNAAVGAKVRAFFAAHLGKGCNRGLGSSVKEFTSN